MGKGQINKKENSPKSEGLKMQLADFQIEALAKQGMIKPFSYQHLNSFGYDMTLGRTFKKFIGDKKDEILDVNNPKEEYFEEVRGDYVIIEPHSFVLGISVEYFIIPKNIIGVCLGRSSYARWGIISHVTPLESNWRGFVTIEISNASNMRIKIPANKGISQVIFLQSQHEPWRDYVAKGGRYNKQEGITLSKGV